MSRRAADGKSLAERGAEHFNAGRARRALEDFTAASRLGFDPAFYYAAHARLSLGQIPEAAADFEAAIRARPDALPAYLDLASLLHRQGRLLDAARTLRAALKRSPANPEILRRLAELKAGPGSAAKSFFELNLPDGKVRVPRLSNLPVEIIALLAGVKPVIHCWAAEADLPAFEELCRRLRLELHIFQGEDRLGVLLGRDAKNLRRTARLWDGEYFNPGRSLGYPPCCTRFYYAHVVAKRGLDLIQSIHRHTRGKGPLPFALNDVFYLYSRVPSVQSGARRQKLFARNPGLDLDLLNLIPWHPCSYRCKPSLKKAAAIWKTARKAAPGFASALRACLARPVVFWDWDRFAVLRRRPGPAVSYAAVEPPLSSLEPRLLARLRSADRIEPTPKGLRLWKGPRPLGLLGGSPAPILLDFE